MDYGDKTLAWVAEMTLKHGMASMNHYTKEFVDAISRPEFCAAQQQRRFIEREPAVLPKPWANAFLAGVAEFIAQRNDMEPPPWCEHPQRFLTDPLFFGVREETRAWMLAETPGPFRRRNLFCGYVWLHSNRWRTLHG